MWITKKSVTNPVIRQRDWAQHISNADFRSAKVATFVAVVNSRPCCLNMTEIRAGVYLTGLRHDSLAGGRKMLYCSF